MNLIEIAKQYKQAEIFKLSSGSVNAEKFIEDILVVCGYLNQRPEQTWIISLEDKYDFSVTLMALLIANKTPVLLPNTKPGTLIDYAYQHDAVLDSQTLNDARNYTVHCKMDVTIVNFAQNKITLFTSGSTGKPKEITRSFVSIINEINTLEHCFGHLLEGKLIYSSVPTCHMYGLIFNVLWPLLFGRTIVNAPIKQIGDLAKVVENDANSVIITSPTLLSRLDCLSKQISDSLFFSSGAALTESTAQMLDQQFNIRPIEILGSTETGAMAYRTQLENPLWQNFPSVVFSKDVQSDAYQVTSPFFDEEAITLDDLIEVISPKQFKLLGRKSRLIKVEGKRVSLDEIETKLKEHDFIDAAFCYFKTSPRQHVLATIVLNSVGLNFLHQANKQELNKNIKSWMGNYYHAVLIPKQIVHVDKLPISATGKINVRQLQQRSEQSHA